jgi:hypothetical protein
LPLAGCGKSGVSPRYAGAEQGKERPMYIGIGTLLVIIILLIILL